MNNKETNEEKMSPIYFHAHNEIKEYLEDNKVIFKVNGSNNIELFTLKDYNLISNNLLIILKDVNNITIDSIEFLCNKNIILKLPNNEIFIIYCHLNFIDEIKKYIRNIIK